MSFALSLQGIQNRVPLYSCIERLWSGWVDNRVKYVGLRGQWLMGCGPAPGQ